MMIVVANLRLSGFFRVITHWIAVYVRRPITLLGMVIFSSGVLSAFLVNDTICLVTTPLVLELVTRLRRNPIPYLLAIATAYHWKSPKHHNWQPLPYSLRRFRCGACAGRSHRAHDHPEHSRPAY